MKCKTCGQKFRTIKAMGAHYRKKHPGSMASHKKLHRTIRETAKGRIVCPYCEKQFSI